MTNIPNLNKIAFFDEETVVFEYKRPSQRSNSYQSEEQMEKELIKQLVSQGYEYLKDVKDEQSLIINLRKQIEILNNYQFSENEWNQFFNNFLANSQDSIIEKTNKIQNDFLSIL